jgi:hypothetical protein
MPMSALGAERSFTEKVTFESNHNRVSLAFWASIGFKPRRLHDLRFEREANCVALPRFNQSDTPPDSHAL